ncbi:MAG: IS5 family transposase [Chloroflexi bacterium]|nr:IS5 family transposase [Chloroflexota bacterium]
MITLPTGYNTDVLTKSQLQFVAKNLPEPNACTGRPAYSNLELLPGILNVLRSGCRWRDLNQPNHPEGTTHWRRLRFWKKKLRGRPKTGELGQPGPLNHFSVLWEHVLALLNKYKKVDTKLLCLDGTLVPSFNFRERTSFSGKHKAMGVKVSTLVDGNGIPIAATIAPGSWHDMAIAVQTIENIRTSANLYGSMLLADKGYDSLEFRSYLDFKGLQFNIPKRSCTSIGKCLNLYRFHPVLAKQRFVTERTNAWLKSFKRLHFRFDRSTYSFECFLYLAIIVICVRKLLN